MKEVQYVPTITELVKGMWQDMHTTGQKLEERLCRGAVNFQENILEKVAEFLSKVNN